MCVCVCVCVCGECVYAVVCVYVVCVWCVCVWCVCMWCVCVCGVCVCVTCVYLANAFCDQQVCHVTIVFFFDGLSLATSAAFEKKEVVLSPLETVLRSELEIASEECVSHQHQRNVCPIRGMCVPSEGCILYDAHIVAFRTDMTSPRCTSSPPSSQNT